MSLGLSKMRQRALAKILQIATTHSLSAEDIAGAMAAQKAAPEKQPGSGSFLTALLGYLGGVLILSGLFIYAGMMWDDLGSFPRVLLSLGSGIVAFYAGVSLQKNDKTSKASLHLWLLSAILIPTGLFVTLSEYAPGEDPILGGVMVFGMTTALYGFSFRQFDKTSLLFPTILFCLMFIGTFFEYAGLNTPLMWLATGGSFMIMGVKTHLARYAEISPLPLLIGFTAITSSVYYYLGNTSGEGLIAAATLAMIFLGYKIESRALVALSTAFFVCLITKYNSFNWGYRDSDLLRLTALATGISMLFAAHWIKKETESRLSPLWNFFGSSLLFSACMGILYLSPFDILFPIVPAFMLIISMKLGSRALLLSSILALLSFISYYTAQYFANKVGWPIALMVMGMVMIFLCSLALKMNTTIKARTSV